MENFKDIQSNIDKICELLKPQIGITIKNIEFIKEVKNIVNPLIGVLYINYIDDTFESIKENELENYLIELENN